MLPALSAKNRVIQVLKTRCVFLQIAGQSSAEVAIWILKLGRRPELPTIRSHIWGSDGLDTQGLDSNVAIFACFRHA